MGNSISLKVLEQLIREDLEEPVGLQFQYPLTRSIFYHQSNKQKCSFACCKIAPELLPFFPSIFNTENDKTNSNPKQKDKFVSVKVLPKPSFLSKNSKDDIIYLQKDENLKCSLFFTLSQMYDIPLDIIKQIEKRESVIKESATVSNLFENNETNNPNVSEEEEEEEESNHSSDSESSETEPNEELPTSKLTLNLMESQKKQQIDTFVVQDVSLDVKNSEPSTPTTSRVGSIPSDSPSFLKLHRNFHQLDKERRHVRTISFEKRQAISSNPVQILLNSNSESHSSGAKALFSVISPKSSVEKEYHLQKIMQSKLSTSNTTTTSAVAQQQEEEEGADENARINGIFPPKFANIPLLLGIYESKQAFYVILDYHEFNLADVISMNQSILSHCDLKRRFLFYQLIQSLGFCHKNQFAHGKIQPSNILVNEQLWIYMTSLDILYTPPVETLESFSSLQRSVEYTPSTPIVQPSTSSNPLPSSSVSISSTKASLHRAVGMKPSDSDQQSCTFHAQNIFHEGEIVIVQRSSGSFCYGRVVSIQNQYVKVMVSENKLLCKELPMNSVGKLPQSIISINSRPFEEQFEFNSLIFKWQQRQISNYDYLMALNTLVGRKLGDYKNHPVFPWVIDFTSPESWRDLSKSKYRLSKGDEMLDLTFQSKTPHHITEPLSEITYFSYLARKTPKSILSKHVRNRFEAKEYPSSLERMYLWTPDECIPEFFTDATLFKSIHPEMCDLELPDWASSPEEFVQKHRECLESEYVSENLHNWIDLIFGYKLRGEAALEAKNVPWEPENKLSIPINKPFKQLFFEPHPARMPLKQRLESTDENSTALHHLISNMEVFENTNRFSNAYFIKPMYHMTPLLSKNPISRNDLTIEVILSDDLFALGCLLAELYTFKPLFTAKTMDLYFKGKFYPPLEKIPQPVREIVQTLIDLNPTLRKKVFASEAMRNYLSPHFRFMYNIISKFYLLPTYLDRYEFIAENEQKLCQLPEDCFELTMLHVMNFFFSSKSLWIYAIKLLSVRSFATILQQRDKVPSFCNWITTFLHDLFTCEIPSVYRILMTPRVSSLMFHMIGNLKLYMEKVFPFYLEALYNSNSQVVEQAMQTILIISKTAFGVVITLQHIVEPILDRMGRKYLNQVSQFANTYPERVTNCLLVENSYIVELLIKLAVQFTSSNMIAYYLPRLFAMLQKAAKVVQKRREQSQPVLLQEESTTTSSSSSSSTLISLDIYQIMEKLIAFVGSSQVMNTILKHNEQAILDVLDQYDNLSIYTFGKWCHLLRHLLLNCDAEVKVQIVNIMRPQLKKIFQCDVVWDFTLSNGAIFSNSEVNAQSQAQLIDNFFSEPTTSNTTTLTKTTSSNTTATVTTTTTSAPHQQATHTRKPSKFFAIVRKIKGYNRSTSSLLEEEEEFTQLQQSEEDYATAIEHPPIDISSLMTSSSSSSESITAHTPSQLRKAVILYRELCYAVGHSHMRSAILHSKLFEDEMINYLEDFEAMEQDTTLQFNHLLLPSSPTTAEKQNTQLSWMLQNKNVSKQICVSLDNAFDFEFKGTYEMQFTSNVSFAITSIDLFKEDEKIFTTMNNRNVIQLWELETGTLISRFVHVNLSMEAKSFGQVKFLHSVDPVRLCSCDGSTIQITNVDTLKPVMSLGIANTKYAMPFQCFAQQQWNPNLLITASELTLKVFDLRSGKDCYDWKFMNYKSSHYDNVFQNSIMSLQQNKPHIKYIASSIDNYVTVALNNGTVFLLEQHSGLILDSFRAHELRNNAELLDVQCFGNGHFMTLSNESPPQKSSFSSQYSMIPSLAFWNTATVPADLSQFASPLMREELDNAVVNNASDGYAVPEFQTFTCAHVNMDYNVLAVGTNSSICLVNNFGLSSGQSRQPIRLSHGIYHYGNQFPPFTNIRLLPLYKSVLVTCADGSIKVFT